MANVYSVQYAAAYNTVPRVRRDPNMSGYKQVQYWDYTQPATGNDPDTLFTVKIPAMSRLLLPECALWTEGCPAGTVYDWGYGAYVEPDGDAVAASADGLMAGADPGADGLIFGGMNASSTPDDQRPVVLTYVFLARQDVDLTIRIKTSALQTGDVLRGYWTYLNG